MQFGYSSITVTTVTQSPQFAYINYIGIPTVSLAQVSRAFGGYVCLSRVCLSVVVKNLTASAYKSFGIGMEDRTEAHSAGKSRF